MRPQATMVSNAKLQEPTIKNWVPATIPESVGDVAGLFQSEVCVRQEALLSATSRIHQGELSKWPMKARRAGAP